MAEYTYIPIQTGRMAQAYSLTRNRCGDLPRYITGTAPAQ